MKWRFWLLLAAWLLTTEASAQEPAPAVEPAQPAEAVPPAQAPSAPPQEAVAPAPAQSQVPAADAAPSTETPTVPDASGASTPEVTPAPETLSAAELEALGLSLDAPAVDTSLRVSGFADFTTVAPVKNASNAGAGYSSSADHSTFYVGNFNLYLTKNLSDSFRTMGEVRFTYLPNGNTSANPIDPAIPTSTSTAVSGYANNGNIARWGGIILQRVYLEWNIHPLVTVRMGQFLTPYGIWNVDHGSPTYIPVQRPYAIANNWFPERQTGFEAFGRVDLSSSSGVGYHLTLSNGTGPISEYRDLDNNKAVGGRLFYEHRASSYFRVGASGYYGRDTSSTPSYALKGNKVRGIEKVDSQFDVLALAADLQYKWRGLLVQSEWVTQQRKYTSSGRPYIDGSFLGSGFAKDAFSWAGYGLVGYRLPWWQIMPYVIGQYDHELMPTTNVNLKQWVISGGLNLHPIDAVTFKLEYYRSTYHLADLQFHPYQAVQLQAAWAF